MTFTEDNSPEFKRATILNSIRHDDKVLVIYHASCNDGWGAERAASNYFSLLSNLNMNNYEAVPAQYGKESKIPEVDGKFVFIVDFSYPPEQIRDVLEKAKAVVMIDHHVTAISSYNLPENEDLKYSLNFLTVFDHANSESGAMLAWKFFMGHIPVPEIIADIQDRDLWTYKRPNTRASYHGLTAACGDNALFQDLLYRKSVYYDFVRENQSVLNYHDSLCKANADQAVFVDFEGALVPIVNSQAKFSSDVGHILDQDFPFSMTYVVGFNKVIVSLRSKEEGADVSAIAKKYGGGGHVHASGFAFEGDDALSKLDAVLKTSMDCQWKNFKEYTKDKEQSALETEKYVPSVEIAISPVHRKDPLAENMEVILQREINECFPIGKPYKLEKIKRFQLVKVFLRLYLDSDEMVLFDVDEEYFGVFTPDTFCDFKVTVPLCFNKTSLTLYCTDPNRIEGLLNDHNVNIETVFTGRYDGRVDTMSLDVTCQIKSIQPRDILTYTRTSQALRGKLNNISAAYIGVKAI